MWKVTLDNKKVLADGKSQFVITANPAAEVKRFLFKDPKANITVTYNNILRRRYVYGKITVDVFVYPIEKKSMDDYGDALTFLTFVGERRDQLQHICGKTKPQRDRYLSRKIIAAQKVSIA
jgi:hypothetical protein